MGPGSGSCDGVLNTLEHAHINLSGLEIFAKEAVSIISSTFPGTLLLTRIFIVEKTMSLVPIHPIFSP